MSPHSMGLLLPIEAAAVVALVLLALWRRGRRASASAGLDVPERIHDALVHARLPEGAATAIATEAAIFYYALAAWTRKPFAPPGARAFSYHRRNAYAAMLFAVVGIAVVEMAAVDLIVRANHVTAANVLLVVGAVAAIWLFGSS